MIKKKFLKHKAIIFLLVLALLLRFPWLYTTIEKDEGQFGYVAWRWMSGDSLYTELTDNKPPLLYILYSIPILLFGNGIIPIRILNNLLFLVSIIFFFKFIKNFFSKKIAIFSILFYIVFMNIPVFEGYLAMSESLLTPFLIMSVYFFERYISTKRIYFIFISSIFALISLLIKQQAIFIFLLLISGLFIYKERNKIKKTFFIILIPTIAILSIFFLDNQLFPNLFRRTWAELTLSSMGFASGYEHYGYNLLIIIEGSVLFLFFIIGLIKMFRSKRKERDYFLISWLFLASLFALVPPAYGHYYIFLIPPLAIFAGIGIIYSINTSQNKKLFALLTTALLLFTGALVIGHFPDSSLDTKYLRYGWSSLENYDQQIELAKFIKDTTKPTDEIFIFEWEPVIYWLSERLPPKSMGFSYSPRLAEWSYLRDILRKQKNLTKVIFLYEYEGIEEYFDFLSNKKIVYGVTVYEKNTNIDYCYLNLAYKTQDKSICGFISTSFLKQYCSALLSLDFYSCYNITRSTIRDRCLASIALEKKDNNICNRIKNKDFFDFCNSRLKGDLDYTSCVNSLGLEYGEKGAEYMCRRDYAISINGDIRQCDYIKDFDASFLCKERVTSDKTYCENISDKWIYASCMADATLDIDYCRNDKIE